MESDGKKDEQCSGQTGGQGCTSGVKRGEWVTFDPPEKKRVYIYPNKEKLEYKDVTKLKVSSSGNHYLETAGGAHVIVAPGWRAIHLEIGKWTV